MRVLVGLLCFGAAGAATAAKQALDDTTIRVAVKAWLNDRAAAEAKYGHIKDWDTSGVQQSREGDARGASARTASRRLKHASRRAASARRRATHKYSLPGASTPLPRSLPIV